MSADTISYPLSTGLVEETETVVISANPPLLSSLSYLTTEDGYIITTEDGEQITVDTGGTITLSAAQIISFII